MEFTSLRDIIVEAIHIIYAFNKYHEDVLKKVYSIIL